MTLYNVINHLKKQNIQPIKLKWSQKAEGENFHLSTMEQRHHGTKPRPNVRKTMEVTGQNQEVSGCRLVWVTSTNSLFGSVKKCLHNAKIVNQVNSAKHDSTQGKIINQVGCLKSWKSHPRLKARVLHFQQLCQIL